MEGRGWGNVDTGGMRTSLYGCLYALCLLVQADFEAVVVEGVLGDGRQCLQLRPASSPAADGQALGQREHTSP